MYSESCIEEIKNKSKLLEVVEEFTTMKPHGSSLIGKCPLHDDSTPSFHVRSSSEGEKYKCFGCNRGGDIFQFLEDKLKLSYPDSLRYLANKYNVTLIEEGSQNYTIPKWRNKTELSDTIVQWFLKRGISQKTLTFAKISDGLESMPTKEGFVEMHTIQFNYIRKGELVNTKFRGKNKSFKLVKGAELIPYGLDTLIGKKEAFWVEGEIDWASLVEAGYINDTCGVVSVPNGASEHRNNLIYINNCIKEISHIEKHHLGLDNDSNGRKLRDELADRFGKDRCDYIEWKDKKDANDVLKQYGIQGVIDCCAKPVKFPLEGAFTISDFSYEIEDMYSRGLEKGVSIGLRDFSLRFVPGYMTGITGISSHGKSEGTDEVCLRLTIREHQKGAFYSPENKPTQLHYSKMARRIVGKAWEGENRITKEEELQVRNYLENKVFFIKPEKDFSLTSILNSVRVLKQRHGINYFVIDAWNKLSHKSKDLLVTEIALNELALFCESEQVHGFIVAHPKKMEKDKKTGKFNVPTPYDVSGTADFYNKLDNWICIYLDREKQTSTFHIQKVKFSHWGFISSPEYKWDPSSGRYYKEAFPDHTNWITGRLNVKPENPNELPLESNNTVIAADGSDDAF